VNTAAGAVEPRVVIEAGRRGSRLDELWQYRELLYFFVWRDVKVRYKQTLLGAAWAVLQPLLATLIFWLFFGRLAGVGSDGLPYPLFALSGLLVWNLFSRGLGQASDSLVGSSNLLKKVYFPRILVPTSAVLSGIVDFAVASVLLGTMMAYYRVAPGKGALLAPLLAVLGLIAALGAGLWLSAFNVRYRDVRHVVPFLIQMWLFVTPVIYPTGRVVEALERRGLPGWLYGLNPVAGAVDGFRALVLGREVHAGVLAASLAVALVLFVTGCLHFRSVERRFADVL
jgi:lipopolysaccharide transport system permease protein